MSEVDSIEIKIESDAERANRNLDSLLARLTAVSGAISTITGDKSLKDFSKELEDVGKQMQKIAQSSSKAGKRMSDSVAAGTKSAAEHIAKLKETYKDIGKDAKFSGSFEQLRGKKTGYENSLQKYQAEMQKYEASGDIFSKMYERAVSEAAKLQNWIEAINNQLNPKPIDFGIDDAVEEEITEAEKSLDDFEEEFFNSFNNPDKAIKDKEILEKMKAFDSRDMGAEMAEFMDNYAQKGTQAESVVDALTQKFRNLGEVRERLFSSRDETAPTGKSFTEAYQKQLAELEKIDNQWNKLIANAQKRQYQLGGKFNLNTPEGKGFEFEADKLIERYKKVDRTMQQLKKSGKDLAKNPDESLNDFSQTLGAASTSLNRFSSILRAIGMGGFASNVKRISIALSSVEGTFSEFGKMASSAMNKANGASSGLLAKIVSIGSKLGYVAIVVAAVAGAIVLEFKKFQVMFTGVKNGITVLTKGFVGLWKAAGKVVKSFLSIGSEGYQAITPIGKFVNKLIGLFKSRILRKAVTQAIQYAEEGFEKLNEYSKKNGTDFHDNLNSIYQDFKYLGRALATMLEPLVNAIAPVIRKIVDEIVRAIGYINQFTSSILGQSGWTQAKRGVEEWGEAADSAGKSAKEANKQLRAFDEINNITSNDSGGGSGSGSSIDPNDLFEPGNINEAFQKFIDKFKEAWDSGGNMFDIGRDIGDWLKEKLESIDLGGIKETAGKIGKAIATGISGVVSTPGLATDLGSTIAGFINVAIEFVSNFVSNLKFPAIGTFIGDAIKEGLDKIDWEKLKTTALNLGTGLGDLINSLLATDVTDKIGEATANLLLTGINAAFGLLTTVDFYEAGQELSDGINKFFETMSEVDPETGLTGWEKTGEAIQNAATGLLDFVRSAILGIDKTEVESAFSQFFSKLNLGKIVLNTAILEKTLEWQLIKTVATAIGKTFAAPYVFAFKFVVENVKPKVQEKWEDVKRWWNEKKPLDNVKIGLEDLKAKIVNAWNSVSSYWRSKTQLAKVNFTTDNLYTKVTSMWQNVVSYWNSKPVLSTVSVNIDNIKQKVMNAWYDLVNWWNTHKPNLSAIGTNIKLPHLTVTWKTTGAAAKALQKLGLNGLPSFNVAYYAQGGFPEDGWFRASHGEMLGQFDNGKSVVANNNQITQGIADAVYRGNQENNSLMRQEISVLNTQNQLLRQLLEKDTGITEGDLFRSVRRSANTYFETTGRPAFEI